MNGYPWLGHRPTYRFYPLTEEDTDANCKQRTFYRQHDQSVRYPFIFYYGSKLFAFLSPTLNILHSDLLGGLANGFEFPSTRPHYLHMLGRHDPPLSHKGSKQVTKKNCLTLQPFLAVVSNL